MALNLKLANNAKGIIAAPIDASAVTIQLSAGHGARFPVITTGEDYFTITATTVAGDHEIMKVTARAFDVLTVIRGQENTLARPYAAGTIVENRLTAGSFLGELGRVTTLVNTAIATFDPGPGTDLTTANVKAVLFGAITPTEFSTSLATTISKIDGAVSQIGSVNQRIQVETGNRVAAVQGAIDQAIGLVNAEVGARTAAIANYGYSKVGTDNAIAFQANLTQTAFTAYTDTAKTQAVALAAADVRQYTFSQSSITSALAQQSSVITAGYTTYADAKKGEAITVASADVRNYSYSQAQTNSAIAASESRLRSEFVSSGGATEAFVTNYAYSRSQFDSAQAAQTSAITASYQDFATAKKGEAITVAAADVRTYAYSQAAVDSAIASTMSAINTSYSNAVAAAAADVRNYTFSQSSINGALSAQSTTLTTNYQNYANARKGEAITAAAADVRAFTYSQATIDGSFSSQTNTLTANYRQYADTKKSEAITAAAADVRSYTYAAATIDGAIASSTNSVTARLNNAGGSGVTVEAKLSATANAVTGLQGQASLTVDAGGQVTGIKVTAGSGTSNLTFNAANVFFGAPGVTPRNLIGTGLVNGLTRVVILGDAIVDGGITARTLRVGSFDNIIPDPKFYDLPWWGRVGITVADYTSLPDNGWLGGAILLMEANGGALRTSTSKSFTTTPGSTLRLECQVEVSSNFSGDFSVYFFVEGAGLYSMGCPNVGTWADGSYPGWPIQFHTGSAAGRGSYNQTITLPNSSASATAHMVIVDRISAGSIALGSCSATRVGDSTLIKDGAITTGKLTAECVTTDNLIANGVTVLDKFGEVAIAVFAAPRRFKLDLKVYQAPIYTDAEGGPESTKGWVIEAYSDQGGGFGYWYNIFTCYRSGQFNDVFDLDANTASLPYYRVRKNDGSSNLTVTVLKVYK